MPLPFLWILAAGTLGTWLGYIFGSSEAQEEIEALQRLVQELHELNQQREAELEALRQHIDELQREIDEIKASRGVLTRLLRWIAGEHPEVLERYQAIESARQEAAEINRDQARHTRRVEAEYRRVQDLYPREMRELQERLSR